MFGNQGAHGTVSSLIQPPAACSKVAGLQEIFSSIQGEGLLVGRRQIFVRFNACHLHCAYCDTPQKPAAVACGIEPLPGQGKTVSLPNPLPVSTVLTWIEKLAALTPQHSVSFTGGEPLLYVDFLQELLPYIQKIRPILPVYLETSGTQPNALEALLPWIDIVAMDIKLPSATGEAMQIDNHRRFFQVAQSKTCFIKLVFCETTPIEELLPVHDIVTDKDCPIMLQPMTDRITGNNTVSAARIFQMEAYLSRYYSDVRVIPQTHKMLDLL